MPAGRPQIFRLLILVLSLILLPLARAESAQEAANRLVVEAKLLADQPTRPTLTATASRC